MVAPSNSNSPATTPHSRKRYHSSSSIPLKRSETGHSRTKKRKICHPDFPPPEFYENVSKNYLEKSTLRVHNEENSREGLFAINPVNSPPLTYPYFGRTRRSYKELAQLSPLAQRVAVEGLPDLSHLRGYKAPGTHCGVMSSRQSSLGRRKRNSQSPQKRSRSPSKGRGTTNSTSTKSTGPYDRSFLQHLIDHRSLPPDYEYDDGRLPPEAEKLAEMNQMFAENVEALSPAQFSDANFKQFQRENSHASKESRIQPGSCVNSSIRQ